MSLFSLKIEHVEFKKKFYRRTLFLLLPIKGGKTQYLVEEISLFYFPGENNVTYVCLQTVHDQVMQKILQAKGLHFLFVESVLTYLHRAFTLVKVSCSPPVSSVNAPARGHLHKNYSCQHRTNYPRQSSNVYHITRGVKQNP